MPHRSVSWNSRPWVAWTRLTALIHRGLTGDLAEAAFYQHPLGASVVAEHYRARTAADQLSTITLPGDRVAAQLVYDKTADRVRTYTDANGGTHTVGAPVVQGDGHRYGSSVVGGGAVAGVPGPVLWQR